MELSKYELQTFERAFKCPRAEWHELQLRVALLYDCKREALRDAQLELAEARIRIRELTDSYPC